MYIFPVICTAFGRRHYQVLSLLLYTDNNGTKEIKEKALRVSSSVLGTLHVLVAFCITE